MAKKQRRGCTGCGCRVLGTLFVLLVLVGAWVAAVQYGIPEKLGLREPPAQRIMGGAPDRPGGAALFDELAEAGFGTEGATVYVLPVEGTEHSVAIALLDASQGFSFGSSDQGGFIENMEQMAGGPAAEEYAIRRVAVDYYGDDGESLLRLTVASETINQYARGEITREALLQAMDGEANTTAQFQMGGLQ